ncbi:hypothetical protein FQR65_LT16543 [Abscondita terminalis]|nr:hypothetical protein FQR65_LT16543 [Abscondita terminalis]
MALIGLSSIAEIFSDEITVLRRGENCVESGNILEFNFDGALGVIKAKVVARYIHCSIGEQANYQIRGAVSVNMEKEIIRLQTPSRRSCGDYQKGLCTRGDGCAYSHHDWDKTNIFECPICKEVILSGQMSCLLKCNHRRDRRMNMEATSVVDEVLSPDNNSSSSASCFSPLSFNSTSIGSESTLRKVQEAQEAPTPKRDDFRKRKLPVSAPSINDVNQKAYQYFEKKQQMLEEQNPTKTNTTIESLDPDLAFLHSVLPDMKSMDGTQKRRFKLGILNLSEEILNPPQIPKTSQRSYIQNLQDSSSQGNMEVSRELQSEIRDPVRENFNSSSWIRNSANRNFHCSSEENAEALSGPPFNMTEFIQYNNN